MITQKGYEEIIKLDSIRTVRVLLKLMELANYKGNIEVTQVELSKMLNLKNRANINIAVGELIKKDFIRKKIDKRKITYFINPNYFVTPEGYKVLQKNYSSIDVDLEISELFNNLEEGDLFV